MKVANIVTKNKISVSDEFNVVEVMDSIIHGLPTLIVGYDYVDKHYPAFDITNTKLGPDLYWTYKRTEKRDKFEQGLSEFITKVYQDLTKQLNYIFVDPLQQKTQTLWKITRKIAILKDSHTYVHGEMIYVYGEKLIFGIDLNLMKYMGMDTQKIKDKIKQISSMFLDDKKLFIEYKKNVAGLGTQVKYLPFLYSITNGQNNSASLIHLPRKG